MTEFQDDSLGDDQTFTGGSADREPMSIGDEATIGGTEGESHDPFDGEIAFVDLNARYNIEGVLGKGGMGEVLLATDKTLGRKVAIKRMIGDGAKNRVAVSRFLSEARAIARLDHDNIVDVYDSAQSEDGPFMVMQYIDGGSVLDRCREGKIPVEEAIDLVCQLCDALTMCHEAGIVHRDIKPANILLTKDNSPRLTDFGLVKDEAEDHGQTVAGSVLGTLDFMPPEQRKDAKLVDSRSDLWSLAATLYQMVTSRSPRVIKLAELPSSLQPILEKALEEDKSERYQTAQEFREALQKSLGVSASKRFITNTDLALGECPSCNTHNESSRKFCRECGHLLQVLCLHCEAEMPVWDKVCGECGTHQALLATQNEAFELAEKYIYQGNLEKAFEELSNLDVTGIDEERLSLLEMLEFFVEAKKLYDQRDYHGCLNLLNQINLADSNESCRILEEKAETNIERLEDLMDEIDSLKHDDNPRILLPLIDEAISLSHDSTELKKQRDRLSANDAKNWQVRVDALEKAKNFYECKDFSSCLNELQRIDESVFDNDAEQLLGLAEAGRDRLQELLDQIENVADQSDPNLILRWVIDALDLSNNKEYLERRRVDLENQIDAEKATYKTSLADAQEHFKRHLYENCLSSLDNISPYLMDAEAEGLKNRATDRLNQLNALLSEINSGFNNEDPTQIIKLIDQAIDLTPDTTELLKKKKRLSALDKENQLQKKEHFATANRSFEKKEFKACLQEISKIKLYLYDEEVESLKGQAEKNASQLDSLLTKIDSIDNDVDPRFILPLLDDAIELSSKPYQLELQRDRYRKQDEANHKTLKDAYENAARLFSENDFAACLSELARISPFVRTDDCLELESKASESQERRRSLRLAIKNKLEQKDVVDLIPLIEEAISLEKSKEEISRLKELKIRASSRHDQLEGKVEFLLADAKAAFNRADYSTAIRLIGEMPRGFEHDESADLVNISKDLESCRVEASESLEKQLRRRLPKFETRLSLKYLSKIDEQGVRDAKYQTGLLLYRQKVEKKRAEFRRKVKIRVSVVALIFALAGSGYAGKLYLEWQDQKLEAAVKENRWEDALYLDPRNEQALFGQTEKLLKTKPLNPERIQANLNLLDAITPSRSRLNGLKKELHIALASLAVKDGDTNLAQNELTNAIDLGADENILSELYVDLSIAHQKKATELLRENSWNAARQECEKAIECGADEGSVNRLLAETYVQEGEQNLKSKFADKAISSFETAVALNPEMNLQSKISDARELLPKEEIPPTEEADVPDSSSDPVVESKPMKEEPTKETEKEIAMAKLNATQAVATYKRSPQSHTRDQAIESMEILQKISPESSLLADLRKSVQDIDDRINLAKQKAITSIQSLAEKMNDAALTVAMDALKDLARASPDHPNLRPMLLQLAQAYTSMNEYSISVGADNTLWDRYQRMRITCSSLGSEIDGLFSHQFYWIEGSKIFAANTDDDDATLVADLSSIDKLDGCRLCVDEVRNQLIVGCTISASPIKLLRIDLADFKVTTLYSGSKLGGTIESLLVIPSTGDVVIAPHSLSVKPGGAPGGMQMVSRDGKSVIDLKSKTWYRHDFDFDPVSKLIYYSTFPTYNGKTPSGYSGIRIMNADATTDDPLAEFDKQVQIALDPFGNTLYLTKVMKDQADNRVYKLSISDKETSTAFEDELCKTLTYIDYDAITGKLIWTGLSNEGNDVVRSGDKTGSNKTTLFSRNIETRKTPFSSFAFRTILRSE